MKTQLDGESRAPSDPVSAPAIAIRSVSRTFHRSNGQPPLKALDGVTFDIPPHSFVSVVGPSGCGKTTLLRMLNGLIRPDAGEVLVDGKTPTPGPHMGFVFQSFRLMPWRTVRANVEFTLEVQGMGAAERTERTDFYLNMVGLRRFANSYPGELSGGMKQCAALARALVGRPRYLLMDEPLANLDAQTSEFMQLELMRIWRRHEGVFVMVTHSVDEAILLSDRVVLLTSRPGRVAEIFEVPLPHPRWSYDVRAHPEFIRLRAELWRRVKEMVTSDPESEFYLRDRAPADDGNEG